MVGALDQANTNKSSACKLLLSVMKDPDPLVRHYAAHAIGKMAVLPDQSIPALTAALTDSDTRVRYISIFALKEFGSAASVAAPAIRKLETDPEENVRKSAKEIADYLENVNLEGRR